MEYELPNGDGRVTRFTGTLLSHQSSRREDDQLRWTEISIYRTDGGNYIVHKVGRSRVVHRANQTCTSGTWSFENVPSPFAPCPKCEPVLYTVDQPKGHGDLVFEQPRYTLHFSASAAGAVESAHSQDDDDVVYLTHAARAALVEASEKDPAISEAFTVQRVD